MRIDVTQDDIDKGLRNNCTLCPVALAIRRAIPGSDPWVDDHDISFPSRRMAPIDTPSSSVMEFMHTFDLGDFVAPFSFALDIPGT